MFKIKKISFIVFIILAFVGGLFIVSKKDELPRVAGIQSIGTTEPCEVSDTIEYMYYENKPSTWEDNNKFGLYIYAENKDFFEIAQKLVNSDGGDWGYVLIPFNVKDRDEGKWGRVFNQLNNKHLIPVIQLWDIDVDDYKDQTKDAAEFLNGFVWPIKYRYISAYNEMNDSKFWYGRVAPREYAQILDYTITTFKKENPDFFVMNGAFNVSANDTNSSMDSFEYMGEMNKAIPGIFDKLDGWASHPYPQPNFSGDPHADGRWSIRAYDDELDYLKNNLGVKKELPIFITETGWAHAEGNSYNSSYLPVDTVGEFFKIAFEEVWLKDDRVRAVMPFTIRYNAPYDHFSWVNSDNVPYKHYDVIKSLEKVKGDPPKMSIQILEVGNCN